MLITLPDTIEADFKAHWAETEDHEGYEYGQSLIDYRAGYMKALANLERKAGLQLAEITHIESY
jgi:hypothetical protein